MNINAVIAGVAEIKNLVIEISNFIINMELARDYDNNFWLVLFYVEGNVR